MKLKEFLKRLNDYVASNPNALNLDVIVSRDAEGNGYNTSFLDISVGEYDKESDEFTEEASINAICIN